MRNAILGFRDLWETRICRLLGETRVPVIAPLLGFFVCLALLLLDGIKSRNGYSFYLLVDGLKVMGMIALGAYLPMRMAGSRQINLAVIASGIVACVVFAFLAGEGKAILPVLGLVLASRLLLQIFFVRIASALPVGWRIGLGFLLCLSLFQLFTYLSSGWHDFSPLAIVRPHRLAFLLILPLLELELGTATSRGLFRRQLWFPTQLFFPVPTRLQDWAESRQPARVQLRGLFDVILGFSFLYGSFWMFQTSFQSWLQLSSVGEYFAFGLVSYVKVYLYSCGAVSVPVGLARLCGFAMPDAFTLPLLAASPFDRWRRWNTYFYRFFRFTIFLPLARRFQSTFLAVMAVFLACAFFHVGVVFPFEPSSLAERYLASGVTTFFLGHGLAVYVGLKLNLSIFAGGRRAGWLGVAVTWITMIALHALRWESP